MIYVITENRLDMSRPNVRRYTTETLAIEAVRRGEVPGVNLIQFPDGRKIRGSQAVKEWAGLVG